MPSHRGQYLKDCENLECNGGGDNIRHCRNDAFVCRKCYYRLPERLRWGLWVKKDDRPGDLAGRVVLALNWLDENPE